MPEVQFFFDFSCPWTYLAFGRLREAAMRTGATIDWRPFSLAALCRELGVDPDRRFSPDPRVAAWQEADLRDWARYCDVPLRLPPGWPAEMPRALAGAALAAEAGKAANWCRAVFAACYGAGEPVESDAALAAVAAEAGLDPAGIGAAVDEARWAAVVASNGAELLRRGGFASATFFVGEQMLVGNERMPLVEFALAQASDRSFVMPGQHGSAQNQGETR